ncbi:hypothetical protein AB0M39_31710 [Streptomyces sp. NPDC051907]|uniref:hypothetical protein n=1 Tax=Streptomyces sp. NPDC051907 TaxID=3155284 RepID=UPI003412F4E4
MPMSPSIRLLNIFHGLSQAGRAIAAAATGIDGEDWQLVAHGIRADGFDDRLGDIAISTDSPGTAGSFVRLSELLTSPVWQAHPVRLEDIWNTLPVDLAHPLAGGRRHTPIATTRATAVAHDPPTSKAVVGPREWLTILPPGGGSGGCHSPAGCRKAEHLSTTADEGAGRPTRIQQAPPVHGFRPPGIPDMGRPTTCGSTQGPAGCTQADLCSGTRSYLGLDYRFPVIDPLPRELHPLMAWWAVLYAMCRLVKLEPATWAGHTSHVNGGHALAIEQLLTAARAHLPVLIADTLDDVAGA